MKASLILVLFVLATLEPARAKVVLSEGQWRTEMSGFIEADYAHDTRTSFLESAGNFPVRGIDTPTGQSGRNALSLRNSRIGFTLLPPGQETWKPKLYVEFDLLGNRSSWAIGRSKDTYFNDPSLRFRHYYASIEHEGWQLFTGQYWTLFGWGPTYFVTTVSVAPGPGVIYQRTKQINVIKSLVDGDHLTQIGFAFEHASQKAGGVPNLEAGAKYAYRGLTSGFASPSGDVKAEPLSFALSATMRKFAVGATNSTSQNMQRMNAYAGALDLMLPILPSPDGKSTSNTLTLTAETSTGNGYGDAFPGWTANLPLFPDSTATENTYLNQGQGGFEGNGRFHLFQLFTWNTQLQYHFPGELKLFMTLGHSELNSNNVAGLGPVHPNFAPYSKAAMDFINLFHDFSNELRAAVEYGKFRTRYVDSTQLMSERYQATIYYRF